MRARTARRRSSIAAARRAAASAFFSRTSANAPRDKARSCSSLGSKSGSARLICPVATRPMVPRAREMLSQRRGGAAAHDRVHRFGPEPPRASLPLLAATRRRRRPRVGVARYERTVAAGRPDHRPGAQSDDGRRCYRSSGSESRVALGLLEVGITPAQCRPHEPAQQAVPAPGPVRMTDA